MLVDAAAKSTFGKRRDGFKPRGRCPVVDVAESTIIDARENPTFELNPELVDGAAESTFTEAMVNPPLEVVVDSVFDAAKSTFIKEGDPDSLEFAE